VRGPDAPCIRCGIQTVFHDYLCTSCFSEWAEREPLLRAADAIAILELEDYVNDLVAFEEYKGEL
jgi:hypothetical protein